MKTFVMIVGLCLIIGFNSGCTNFDMSSASSTPTSITAQDSATRAIDSIRVLLTDAYRHTEILNSNHAISLEAAKDIDRRLKQIEAYVDRADQTLASGNLESASDLMALVGEELMPILLEIGLEIKSK